MKATVLETFEDKYTGELHRPGEALELESDRAEDLAARGLIKVEVARKKATRKEQKHA